MKKIFALTVAMMIALPVIAQQVNTLDAFRLAYEKQEQAALTQYSRALDTIMLNLKKRGDLDNILILEAENARFEKEKTVLSPKDAKDVFQPATEAYYQTMVTLLGKYINALDGLIKKEVTADRIEEAKVIKTEKDKISFLLADMQSKLPVKSVVENPKTVVEKPKASISTNEVTSGPILFRSKFISSDARNWQPSGGQWRVKGGRYIQNESRGVFWNWAGRREWQNYEVSCRTLFSEGNQEVSIGFRSPDPKNAYYFCLAGKAQLIAISKIIDGMETYNVEHTPWQLKDNQWYSVRIEVRGRQIRAFLDNELVLQYEAQDMPVQGRVGLRTFNSHGEFEDFQVKALVK